MVDKLTYIPVFTAHPTEAKRRTILESLRRIFVTSERLREPRLSRAERDEVMQRIKNEIQILWKTDEVRIHRPQVRDEIRNGLFYFRECLFEAVPKVYRYFERAVALNYGRNDDGRPAVTVPSFLKFGSWIGGDRDGNPFVRPETTEMAVRMHTREAVAYYLQQLNMLSRRTHLLQQPGATLSGTARQHRQRRATL